MALSQKNINYKRRNELDPITREALDSIFSQAVAGLRQCNADPSGHTPEPSPVSGISVLGADGVFDVQIQDNNEVNRGITYFLEYSTTPNFAQPTVLHLGPSRNWRGFLGNQTLYWRVYKQYPTSPPTSPIYFGGATAPTGVVGGGASGPTVQPSTGSGTAPSSGLQGGSGYGFHNTRNSQSQNLKD